MDSAKARLTPVATNPLLLFLFSPFVTPVELFRLSLGSRALAAAAEELAAESVAACFTEEERAKAPKDARAWRKGSTWVGVLAELAALREPLAFTCLGAHAMARDGRLLTMRVPRTAEQSPPCLGSRLACCFPPAMRAGLHYAEVTLVASPEGHRHLFGIVDARAAGKRNVHRCSAAWFFSGNDASLVRGLPVAWEGCDWTGAGDTRLFRAVQGDTIGLLLDLERDALSVLVNGRRLGVLVPPGGLGAGAVGGRRRWCWAVFLGNHLGDLVRLSGGWDAEGLAGGSAGGSAKARGGGGGRDNGGHGASAALTRTAPFVFGAPADAASPLSPPSGLAAVAALAETEWPSARCEAWRRVLGCRARWAADSDAMEEAVAKGEAPEASLRRAPVVTMPCEENEELSWRTVHGSRQWRRHFQHYGDDDSGNYGE